MGRPWRFGLAIIVAGTLASCDAGRGTRGSIQVGLVDYPGYIEGFNYGVRLEVDGVVAAERLLQDFDRGPAQRYQDQTWRTAFDAPVGEVEVVSHLVISDGTEPPPPDFTTARKRPTAVDGFRDPCRTKLNVRPGGTTRVTLDWTTGCVSEVF